MAHEPGRRTVGFSITRFNFNVTTSNGDVVTIVDTGTIDLHGDDVFAFITDEGEALPVVISEIGGFNTVFADMTTNPVTGREPDDVYIEVISGSGGEYDAENPQLLPILAELGMDFNSSSHGVILLSGNETFLSDLGASGCDTEAPENPFYYEEWDEEGVVKQVEFLSNETDQGLNCEKTAFNRTEDSSTVVYVMKFNAEPEDIPNWRWYQLAAYWLEVRGVPSSIIPVYEPL